MPAQNLIMNGSNHVAVSEFTCHSTSEPLSTPLWSCQEQRPASEGLNGITTHSRVPSQGAIASDYSSHRANDLTDSDFALTHEDDGREAFMEAAPAVDHEYSCALADRVSQMMPGSIATKNGVAPLTCQAEYHIPVTASTATQVAPIGSPRPSTALVDRQYEQIGPPERQSSPERLASAPQHDLYASNLLKTFSFGTATTPHPSVAGPSSQGLPGASTSQAPRRRRTSVASTNTLGLPYTPASVASSDGCASHHGVSEHHHPTSTSSRNSPTGTHATYSDERHDDDRSEPQIDVSSEIHEDFGRYTSWNRSRRSFASSAHSGKRGQVVLIPLPSSLEVRDREDSAAADHRPSRSLEGLKPDNFEHANNLYEYRPPLAPSTTTSVPEDFDASWAKTTAGISVFEWDPSERADALGGFQGPSGSSRGFRGNGANPANSGRRSSTSTTSTDAFSRHLKQLGGQEYADEKAKWTFIRVPDGGQDKRSRDRDQRSSISSIWRVSASSRIGSSVASRDAIAAFAFVGRMLGKDKGAPWKGMALDAEELWSSGANGRYRVARKNHAVEGKTPQERLHIVRHGNSLYSPSGSPSIIIHRHSKAAGFSITCHPRHKTSLNDQGRSAEAAAQDAHMPTTDRKKSSPRILLASQKVQEAYTSTSTTNKLKTHGFLNKSSRHSSHDQHDREQEAKRENEKQHQKRLGKGKEKSTGKTTSSQEPASDETGGATNSESSKGSVSTGHETNPSMPSTSQLPQPRTARSAVDHPARSQDTLSSHKTITYQARRSKVLLSGEDDGFRQRVPARLPQPDTCANIPLEDSSRKDNHAASFFGWGKKSTLFQRQHQTSYKPPWAVSQARYHGQKELVEDLAASLQHVGLIPTSDEVRASQKQKQRPEARNITKSLTPPETLSVFASVPADLLYMLLPLWPGETDISTDTTTPFPMPFIPVEERMYLLIYYSPYECQDEKSKKGSKKSSHGSSSSSRDSAKARKPTLLQRFHFCARMVTYRDIQGSGVRCPDAGLSVIGPLQEAYASMPQQKHVHTEFTVIGQSHSRDRGVELIPEGFEKLGLATRELDPDASLKSEDDSSSISKEEEDPYTIHVLTPIGRAVVEMAWLGAMALTSFG